MGHLAGKPVLAFLVPSNPAIHPHSRSPPPNPQPKKEVGRIYHTWDPPCTWAAKPGAQTVPGSGGEPGREPGLAVRHTWPAFIGSLFHL